MKLETREIMFHASIVTVWSWPFICLSETHVKTVYEPQIDAAYRIPQIFLCGLPVMTCSSAI